MKAILQVDPSAATPLWRQIEEGVRRLVATGGLSAGALMPSVRDLARELGVNPNTVVKAYQHLVEAGVLSVRRGRLFIIAADMLHLDFKLLKILHPRAFGDPFGRALMQGLNKQRKTDGV